MQLIDREVTLQLLDKSIELVDGNSLQDRMTKNGLLIAKRIISKQPTIEPEVQHGWWVESTSRGSYSIYCSCCGSHKETICPSDYCPSCGTRMKGTITKDSKGETIHE